MTRYGFTETDRKYAGRTEKIATHLAQRDGLEVRVTQRDGHALLVTRDFRLDRVNFIVDDGFVRGAEIG